MTAARNRMLATLLRNAAADVCDLADLVEAELAPANGSGDRPPSPSPRCVTGHESHSLETKEEPGGDTMTPGQYRTVLKMLGLTRGTQAAEALGVHPATHTRYLQHGPRGTAVLLLRAYLRHGLPPWPSNQGNHA